MEKTKIVKYNGKLFALLDEVEHKGVTYYNAVEVVDSKLSRNFTILKKYVKNGEEMCSYVSDKNELVGSFKLLIDKIAKDTKDVLLPEGSMFDINGRKYMLISYIPYNANIYMMLVSAKPEVDVMVAKVTAERNSNNEMSIQDVTGTDEAIAVMKAHALVYGDNK